MPHPYDKNAPIIPAKQLGMFAIGARLPTPILSEFIPDAGNDKTYSKWYRVTDNTMRLLVDGRNGKIGQLVALDGYTGTLFDEIRVGMRVDDAMKRVSSLYYKQDALYCRGIDGLMLELSDTDIAITQIAQATISTITIFHPHTFTLHWLHGDWHTYPIPDQHPITTNADAYLERGNRAFALWELDDAHQAYTHAIEHAPLFAEAYYQLGCVLIEKNDYGNANRQLMICIELNPTDARPYYQLGMIAYQMKDADTAIRQYSTAINLQPNFVDAHVGRGYVYHEIHRDYPRAIADFDVALQLNPHNAQAYYYRGNAYVALGKHEQALADYDNALAHQPTHILAQNARARVINR